MPGAAAWDMEADVVVVGSGAAGLAAALTAAAGGARVIVLEKAHVIGGTTAMSGAGIWIPANRHMLAAGHDDSADAALAYIRATAPPGWAEEEEALWRAFVETAPVALDFIEAHTPLRFELIHHPDLYVEAPGGKEFGRMLTPRMLSRSLVGSWRDRIRRSVKPQIFTYEEAILGPVLRHPVRTVARMGPILLWRWLTGRVAMGNALVVGLLRGCLDHGCEVLAGARVTALLTDDARNGDGAVTGVEAEIGGALRRVRARKGVVLATGGFEWDESRLAQHFPRDFVLRASPRTNTGDGQRLAEALGARMARLDQANIYPVTPTRYEGQPHAFPINQLDAPHCILVGRHGRRFVSEGNRNLGVSLIEREPANGRPLHLPAWRIFDAEFARQNPYDLRLWKKRRGDLRRAASISGLARATELDPAVLTATVQRFNGFVRQGRDEDFHRGETAWERFYTDDPERPERNGALGAIERPPFFATPYYVGILGTKGGPRTDERAQVVRQDGGVVPGLYCAGVAMANPIGSKNVGAGTTIGPCLTWGYIAARDLLRANR
jgi:3-oxosteroid 1-dehydrogenase